MKYGQVRSSVSTKLSNKEVRSHTVDAVQAGRNGEKHAWDLGFGLKARGEGKGRENLKKNGAAFAFGDSGKKKASTLMDTLDLILTSYPVRRLGEIATRARNIMQKRPSLIGRSHADQLGRTKN